MLNEINTCTKLSSIIYIRPSQAKLFGLSKSHLLSLIKNKNVPSYLPSPKLRLVKVQDLINYIENTKINDVSDENEIYSSNHNSKINNIKDKK